MSFLRNGVRLWTGYCRRSANGTKRGHGLSANARHAVETLEPRHALSVTVPAMPSVVSASPGNGQIVLSWTAADDGGSPLTGFDVSYRDMNVSPTPKHLLVGPTAGAATLTGLTNFDPYFVSVAAINKIGTGPSKSVPTVYPTSTPAPTIGVVTAGDSCATVKWNPPSFVQQAYPVVGYSIQSSTDNGATWKGQAYSPTASATTGIVNGLSNGVAYRFRVVASLKGGALTPCSGPSDSVTPQPLPAAPSNVVASPGSGQVALSWNAPTNAGPILFYKLQYLPDPAGGWLTVPGTFQATTAIVGSLINGRSYSFRVQAANATGFGYYSNTVSATPLASAVTTPSSPTNLVATPGSSSVALSWAAPASNGGSPISDYTIRYSSNSGASWTTFPRSVSVSPSATVTGLSGGTAYMFQVAAVNAAGPSVFSAGVVATPVQSATPPSAPTNLVAAPASSSVALSWSAPSSDGGSPLTNYVIRYSSNGGATWVTLPRSATASTSASVTGLTNGTAYIFQAAGVNTAGVGSFSAGASATPQGAVQNVLYNRSATHAIAIWTAVDANGVGVGPACVVNPGGAAGFSNPTGRVYVAMAPYSASLTPRWYTVVSPNIRVVVPVAATYNVNVSVNPVTKLLSVSVNGSVGQYMY